jgi:hypothetical protein
MAGGQHRPVEQAVRPVPVHPEILKQVAALETRILEMERTIVAAVRAEGLVTKDPKG